MELYSSVYQEVKPYCALCHRPRKSKVYTLCYDHMEEYYSLGLPGPRYSPIKFKEMNDRIKEGLDRQSI